LFVPEAELAPALARLQPAAAASARSAADELLSGIWRLFGGEPRQLGFPPDWARSPFSEQAPDRLDLTRHWTHSKLDLDFDYRSLWEPARFGAAFTLGRAYRLTGDRRFQQGFSELLSSWLAANPPNCGPHWASGQEVALRLIALIFAAFAFAPLEPGLEDRLLVALGAHAERIPATLRYARAQRNNHLLSEAVGLYSVGVLFDEFRQAGRWRALGRRWLIAALRDQVLPDGGYIQHSANYQRLALGLGLWAARLAETRQDPLPKETQQALERMADMLRGLTDPQSGRVPTFGHDDGSNLLALTACEQADYRPIVQAAHLALRRQPAFEPGPWDELAVWLGLPPSSASVTEPSQPQCEFPEAGLYLLHGEESWAALRSVHYRSRPSHSDQLHLSLWWKGHNLAGDAGSYRYTGELGAYLASAASHNGVLIDGSEPMVRAGRFLWLGWSHARFLARATEGPMETLAAEHLTSGVLHRRSVVHTGDALWVVIDELLGRGSHQGQVNWTLPDWTWHLDVRQLNLDGDPGRVVLMIEPDQAALGLYRAGKRLAGEANVPRSDLLGWAAPTYGTREPALSLIVQIEGELPLRLATWWRLGERGLAGLALAYAQDQLALL
jgi:hypothetical protein